MVLCTSEGRAVSNPVVRVLCKKLTVKCLVFRDRPEIIHSGYFNSTSSSPLLLRGATDSARILFHAVATQANASEGLAQGPYVVARDRFEPVTLWTKGVKSTNEPPHPSKSLWTFALARYQVFRKYSPWQIIPMQIPETEKIWLF